MLTIRNIFLSSLCITVAGCSNNVVPSSADELVTAAHSESATGPMSRIVRGDGGVSDFYSYDGALPDGPGTLIRQEPLGVQQQVPGAAANIRLLYSSTDGIDGETPIPVSGSSFLPEGQAPDGGWPLISWTHGTVGIADICAPSWTGYVPFHQEYLKTWLDQGYAIVASDYQGLGTAGTHPYLATKPASYNNLDIIRAVQSADFPVSDKVVLIGQSQGAAAAFATAGHAEDYAPELNILGVVATGIPLFTPRTIEIIQQTRPNDVPDPMLGYNFLALTLIEQLDPEFKNADYISDLAKPIALSVDTTCHSDVKNMVIESELTYNKSFKISPNEALKIAFGQMGYPKFDLPVPVYIGSGVNDRDTPLRMQAGVVKMACAAGTTVESRIYPEHDHLTVLNHSTVDSVPFVERAFAGEAIDGNCDALPFEQ
jgi:pimeloyl-ACP methyl ester carboxylesterase